MDTAEAARLMGVRERNLLRYLWRLRFAVVSREKGKSESVIWNGGLIRKASEIAGRSPKVSWIRAIEVAGGRIPATGGLGPFPDDVDPSVLKEK